MQHRTKSVADVSVTNEIIAHIALAYLVVQNKDRVALIVVSWHPGWEEVETESGNAREKFLNKG